MPNLFSYVALFLLFPILSVIIFRRLPIGYAIVVVLLMGLLLLPERLAFDLVGFPALDKTTVPAICVLLLSSLAARFSSQKIRFRSEAGGRSESAISLAPKQRGWKLSLIDVLLALYLVAPLLTAWFNQDPVAVGPYFLKGLGWREAFSDFISALLICIPFLVARRFLGRGLDLELILRLIAVSGFLYSWLVLFEIRMSPQLHTWVYGFFPHQFSQQMRQDGFRAVVFTVHGLKVGLFLALAASAAASIYRGTAGPARTKWLWLSAWLLFVLYLQKSLGAFIIAVSLVGMILFLTLRLRLLVLVAIALIVITYPAVRTSTFFNSEEILEAATKVDLERADSLAFRLAQEDTLIDKALMRPVFGWGSWGRGRVFNEAGRDISITDGLWIIELGRGGWFGYVAIFGLWTLPIVALWRLRAIPEQHLAAPVAIAGLLVACLVDFVPNSGLPPIVWLCAGALAGWIRGQRESSANVLLNRPQSRML